MFFLLRPRTSLRLAKLNLGMLPTLGIVTVWTRSTYEAPLWKENDF